MKQHLQSKAPDETLDAQLSRRREQLATVESETAAVDAELQAVAAEREPLTLRSLDDPASEAALSVLEQRDATLTARQRSLAAKADALRKEIAALDARLLRVNVDAELAELDGPMQAERVARAQRVDAAVATLKQEIEEYMSFCTTMYARAVAVGLPNIRRLTDPFPVVAAVLRIWEPLRRAAPLVANRYDDTLAALARTLWPGIPPNHEAPAGWHPRVPRTPTNPNPSTAVSATAA